jgi:alkyldihydroxyacetonephosphate synthase
MPEVHERVPYMRWSGWGAAGEERPLGDAQLALVRQALGVEREGTPPPALDEVALAPSRLDGAARAALEAAVGAEHVRDDHESRVVHAAGKSTPDLLRWRSGATHDAPDAIVLPGSHDEVVAVLAACAEHGVAVVPFGGGSSVVGGLEPLRGRFAALISLDLRRLDRLVSVDDVSLTATLQAGLRGPEADALLREHGLMLGHYPQSFPYATIGGFAATRSSGQASAGYGRFDAMVVALKVATPQGTLDLGRSPANAAGPDLRQLFLGSEGVLGVITEVTVRVPRIPEARLYEAWSLPDFATGQAALRRLVQEGAQPTVVRLSDELETLVTGGQSQEAGEGLAGTPAVSGCLLLTGFEGTATAVAARREQAAAILRDAGAGELGRAIGEGWLAHRFDAPYTRDPLFDAGVLSETLETVTSWSAMPALYEAVKTAVSDALAGVGNPLVWCHVSHVYPSGASLYFTVAAPLGDDPQARWAKAKRAASDAISAHGASITHHHAVGRDHVAWMQAEIGELGLEALRAVKHRLDPQGILNPGKLLPDAG